MMSSHSLAFSVCLVVSMGFVGLLVYLYTPFQVGKDLKLRSETIPVQVMSSEMVPDASFPTDAQTKKRMRLTKLLLRYQGELSTLKIENSTLPENMLVVQELEGKIDHIEDMIREI